MATVGMAPTCGPSASTAGANAQPDGPAPAYRHACARAPRTGDLPPRSRRLGIGAGRASSKERALGDEICTEREPTPRRVRPHGPPPPPPRDPGRRPPRPRVDPTGRIVIVARVGISPATEEMRAPRGTAQTARYGRGGGCRSGRQQAGRL